MRRALVLTIAMALAAVAARPAPVQLPLHPGSIVHLNDGDVGCDAFENQALREPKAQLDELRGMRCRRLSGRDWKVLEVRSGFARVRFGQGSLWIVQDAKRRGLLTASLDSANANRPNFGMDPHVAMTMLEHGDLTVLAQIKLKSGGDLRGFLQGNRRLKILNQLSDVSCLERSAGDAGDGCQVSIYVYSNGVRDAQSCSMLVRWRRPLGERYFLPESGAAKFMDANPSQFWGALDWNDHVCNR